MCGAVETCHEWPGGQVTYEVRYCATHAAWEAVAWSQLHEGEGEITKLSTVRREFGPFDSWIEVGHWLASSARMARDIAPAVKAKP